MNVLLIHQAFASMEEPGGTRHAELGNLLAEYGDAMTVIASHVNYATGQPVKHGARKRVYEEQADKVRVLRAYVPAVMHRSYVWRVVAFLSFSVTSVLASLRVGPVDVVMGTSPPIFQAVSAWLVARLRRKPFLLEIRDLWPEFAIGMGILRNPVLIWLSRSLERFLYRRADHIVVNSPAYIDYLTTKGVKAAKISLVPNGVDTTMFDPEAHGEAFRAKYADGSDVLVVYAGALGAANDIDTILDAAERLKGAAHVRILLVGDGKERPRLEAEAKRRGLANVTFTGSVPKSAIPATLAAADICVATLKDIPMFRMTYPNKVFDYMAAGRPMVLAIDGVIRQVVDNAECGIAVSPGNGKALAEAVRSLASNTSRRAQMAACGRSYAIEHFDRTKQGASFRDAIQHVCKLNDS